LSIAEPKPPLNTFVPLAVVASTSFGSIGRTSTLTTSGASILIRDASPVARLRDGAVG